MLRLREQYDVFTSGTETLSLSGDVKEIQLTLDNQKITLIGNFGLTLQAVTPNFQHTGTWYEFFSGDQFSVSSTNTSLLLSAGEFRLYSDQQLPAFKDLATSSLTESDNPTLKVYPNPATDKLSIETSGLIKNIQLLNLDGKIIQQFSPNSYHLSLNMSNLKSGLYLLRVQTNKQLFDEKVIKQ